MTKRFNPPPNWPRPPAGWVPSPDWRPDPAWGPVPPGWQLWVEGPAAPPPGHFRAEAVRSQGTAMVAVSAATCGMAGFVPPLWAARQRPHDAPFRRRMYLCASGLMGLSIVSMVLLAAADEDASGGISGFAGNVGGSLLWINLALAITVAVLVRNTKPSAELTGVAAELARRELRERYRELAKKDPALARSIGVGRPDQRRELDDGGLLDLNTIPAGAIGVLAGLTAGEAERVVEARQKLGRFTDINEVEVYADLPEDTMTMLRERAIIY